MRQIFFIIFMLNLLICNLAHSVEVSSAASAKPEQEMLKKEILKETISETTHSVNINGVDVPYKAIAGTLILKDEQGNPKASIFYIAYHKTGVLNSAKRPITFCFNGGPGSSSVWLHMGVLGPKKVSFNQVGPTSAPYQLVNNPYSLLDTTDLVFIDPVSTGYSRAVPGEDPKQFHGVEEDVKSVAQFIRLYTTRADRWLSPKYLAGESYGTTRAANLAAELHDEHNLYLNGIVLISSILNFQTVFNGKGGNELPYMLALPSYTATAWYHKKLSPELQGDLKKALAESEQFALNEYALALLKGDGIDSEERQKIIQKLAYYTGLSSNYIENSNLRIPLTRFAKELLRNEKRVVGRFDSRYTGIEYDAAGGCIESDPSADALFGVFTSVFNDYVRTDLKWPDDQEYKILANVNPWNYGKSSNESLNVVDNLREVMSRNPALRVFVGSGYYDLATPYFATDYTFRHLSLDPSLRDHVSMAYYEAGHMMYIHEPSLMKMKKDISGWYNP